MSRIVNVEIFKCVGCKSCELACAVAHSESKDPEKAPREKPAPRSRTKVTSAGKLSIPLQCRHCGTAPCVLVCPTGAKHREGDAGPVLHDNDKCIACLQCIMACPFGAIELDSDGKPSVKCDLCAERLTEGLEPACVNACPTAALNFAVAGAVEMTDAKTPVYKVDSEKCTGCTACARACPTAAATGERKKAHEIDQDKCIKCGLCYEACLFDAIVVE